MEEIDQTGGRGRIDGIVVAVIDDHAIIGQGVQGTFAAYEPGATVLYAPSLTELQMKPDVVILDLRLDDGSTPHENLAHLAAFEIPSVVYTSGDDPHLVREAIAGGALAVVRKTAAPEDLVEAVVAASRGDITAGLDWAAAVDADGDFVSDRLSDTEAEVLSLYASGELAGTVARQLNLSQASVNTYISRIRAKYRQAGRNADSRIALFRRAAEDGLISWRG